jgi:hypothetical protein
MSKHTHTPGPWKVRAATFCEDGVPSYEVVMPGTPQMNACDARLIGAAPELLDACERAVEFIMNGVELGFIIMPDPETPDTAHETLPTLIAAIAKVKEVTNG